MQAPNQVHKSIKQAAISLSISSFKSRLVVVVVVVVLALHSTSCIAAHSDERRRSQSSARAHQGRPRTPQHTAQQASTRRERGARESLAAQGAARKVARAHPQLDQHDRSNHHHHHHMLFPCCIFVMKKTTTFG